tara:strand:- start:50604 stop:51260 length:657 start_codon:yes stop_codon:yes gene_type:complete
MWRPFWGFRVHDSCAVRQKAAVLIALCGCLNTADYILSFLHTGVKNMSGGSYNILFLCQGNSARSIMAEAIMNGEGSNHFHAYSAGSHPRGALHPYTADLLSGLGHDLTVFSSKPMEVYSQQDEIKFDFIFTVCDQTAKESCPVFPGAPMSAHWGVPDPAAATGTEAEIRLAFAETYRMLRNRISIFTSLPFASLDRMSLQRRLDQIGETTMPVSDPA